MRTVTRISGIALAAISAAAFIADFSGISVMEAILCAAGLLSGALLTAISVKPAERQNPAEAAPQSEEAELLRRQLAESSEESARLRAYIAELLPKNSGEFHESYVLMGMVFTPKQLMDRLNEMTELELAERGLDFSIDLSPSLPERLCGDMPRIALAVCGMISAAAMRTESGHIALELLSAGGEKLEFRVSDNGRQLSRGELEAALMGKFPEEYRYAERTAAIMHGELKLRNTRAGVSASLVVLLNSAEIRDDLSQNVGC